MTKPLNTIKRRKVADLQPLLSDSPGTSSEAAVKLCQEARSFGLDLRDFLTLAIDVKGSDNVERFTDKDGLLSGYEAALTYLGLPVRDDFRNGVTLDLASDTFNTYSGVRALFPEVVDDILRWSYRQDQIENIGAVVGGSRTINGVEMISTVVNDTEADTQVARPVAELARVPMKTIKASQTSVRFWKFGGGYRTSYEFSRRARLDMLTPYAARMAREVERSKVGVATDLLVNGDGVGAAAAGVTAQSSFNGGPVGTSTNGILSWKHLLAWLIARAKAGTPVDTVLGNWDMYVQWLFMFNVPQLNAGEVAKDLLGKSGFQIGGVPLLSGAVNFALSSTMPANQLLGYSKGDTIEELVESGSLIEESERAIANQSISYVKTENSGYRLPFGDTRSIFNVNG